MSTERGRGMGGAAGRPREQRRRGGIMAVKFLAMLRSGWKPFALLRGYAVEQDLALVGTVLVPLRLM